MGVVAKRKTNYAKDLIDEVNNPSPVAVGQGLILSEQQYELLSLLYFEMHRSEQPDKPATDSSEISDAPVHIRYGMFEVQTLEPHPVLWVPRKIFGRTLTKAESSNYSRNIKKLLGRNLITKDQRYIMISDAGKEALRVYESTNLVQASPVTRLLLHDEFRKNIGLIDSVAKLAQQYGVKELLGDGPGTLHSLLLAVLGVEKGT